ncbi:MFS transporter [Taibaiella chishuiensis]|uniref:Putative MFS family arabinose efflux permease n=1 Tax=Taibaiella chishuiensis TaxID=1434707 RepID=A0A2P8DAX5_9BACT|nr:MFS transporter [Taibaiella chishuiensis]PSK94376.1 putative MFS family arabinose efflux permease [Taibaiella chishuiensis]
MENATPVLSRFNLWLMTISAGLVVANIYYCQPMLGKIAAEFKVTETTVSSIATMTQIGYAAGLLFIVPLGDMLQRKKLILVDFVFIILSLLAMALFRNIYALIGVSFLIGFTSVVPQLFVPMAAQLATDQQRGKAIGTVMSGLLIGILCSRTISGYIGQHLGWREMYYIAAGIMLLNGIALWRFLPELQIHYKGSYSNLMKSLIHYTKSTPQLRLAAIRGALGFASFSAFWTTLVFLMEGPPFFKGSDVAGAFGLVGAGGAIAASLAGRLSNRIVPNKIILITISLMILSWVVFGFSGASIAGLVLGILLLDLGLQATHITNQTIIFALYPEARNRLNTVYMVTYFIGGATGTFLGSLAWHKAQWIGVSVLGGCFTVLALIFHLLYSGRKRVAKTEEQPEPVPDHSV